MSTLMQWVHLLAAAVGVGGMGYLLFVLIPSLGVLTPEQRETLSKPIVARFRWASWSAIALLLISGLYNVRRYYWEEPWDTAWKLLTLKIVLSFTLFLMVLALTIPLRFLKPLRARHRQWLLAAFILSVIVVLISAYLRRG